MECINQAACLGMDTELPESYPGNPVGRCDLDAGYHGVICSSCLPGFKRSGANECTRCYKYEGLFISGVLIGVIVAFTFTVRAVIKSSIKEDNT